MLQIGGRRLLIADQSSPLASYMQHYFEEVLPMLWTIFVILLLMWLLGMVSSYTLGGFIHILLVLALVAVCVQLITGRRAL